MKIELGDYFMPWALADGVVVVWHYDIIEYTYEHLRYRQNGSPYELHYNEVIFSSRRVNA